MSLRTRVLDTPAGAFLRPFFEGPDRLPPWGDARLDADARRRVAQAPPGAAAALGELIDATPRWRLAADEDAALALRLLGALRAPEGLRAVLGAARDAPLDDDLDLFNDLDIPLRSALMQALEDYEPVAMEAMLAFIEQHAAAPGLLPAYLLREGGTDERALALALGYLRPEVALTLAHRGWHVRMVASLGWCEDPRVRDPLAALLDAMPPTGDAAWARAVVNLAEAIERLEGHVTEAQRARVSGAEELHAAEQQRLRTLDQDGHDREEELREGKPTRARLAALATHPTVRVREAVAGHERTPPHVLAALATDRSPDVRYAVGVNGNTSEEIQLDLARDPEPEVRVGLAGSRDLYPSAARALLRDPAVDVRAQVVRWLPVDLLTLALTDPDPEVRQAIAEGDHVSAEILAALADDADAGVRSSVACAAETPTAVRERLLVDPDERVRATARRSVELAQRRAWTS